MTVRLFERDTNLRDVLKVVSVLRDGGLIIYPTDTVYAIGCDAMNVRAVERICALKGVNPAKHNLSIVCPDLSGVAEYAKVSNAAFRLMKTCLPGPFTFILPTGSRLPKIYKNKKEVGVRVPDSNIDRMITVELGNPLLSMSLHDDDEIIEYSTDPSLIAERYADSVDLIVDGGEGGVVPSTVISCLDDDFTIVRQGKGEVQL